MADEFAKRGKVFGPQPLLREVLVANTERQAIDEYVRVAKPRYRTYSERGHDILAGQSLDTDFFDSVSDHVIVGTPTSVTERLVHLVTTLPVDPLLLRPQWPTMDADATINAIERLGKEILPSLLSLKPSPEIKMHADPRLS